MSSRLRVEHLRKSFGGVAAIDDVSLDFPAGSLSAVIGPNGAGKTTFFNLISGRLKPDAGAIWLDQENIAGLDQMQIVRRGVGRAFQIASLFPRFTVEEALCAAVHAHKHSLHWTLSRFPEPSAQRRAREIMDFVGLTPGASVASEHLSHGDQKLLDIALALALEPRVLLLDEPTAGMGREERGRMIETVRYLWAESGMTLIFIEHDMDIVFGVAQSIRVLRYGRVLAEGSPREIKGHPDVVEAYLGTAHGGVPA